MAHPQVIPALVGAAIGVMITAAIAMSVLPDKPPPCPTCPVCAPPAAPATAIDAGAEPGATAPLF